MSEILKLRGAPKPEIGDRVSKVVDYILELVKVTNEEVSREALFKEED